MNSLGLHTPEHIDDIIDWAIYHDVVGFKSYPNNAYDIVFIGFDNTRYEISNGESNFYILDFNVLPIKDYVGQHYSIVTGDIYGGFAVFNELNPNNLIPIKYTRITFGISTPKINCVLHKINEKYNVKGSVCAYEYYIHEYISNLNDYVLIDKGEVLVLPNNFMVVCPQGCNTIEANKLLDFAKPFIDKS